MKKLNEDDQKILDHIKSIVSDGIFKDIEYNLNECYCCYDLNVVDNPKGIFQDSEDYEFIDGIYIDETVSGGYTGDEFMGTCSIKISESEFLQFSYSM